MSVEHQPTPGQNHERAQAELESMAKEQLEKIATSPEAAQEHAEQRAEAAREVIKQHEPEQTAPAQEQEATPAPTLAARIDHALNYSQTLASVQRKLTPVSRTFSQIIHTPAVEKTSEVLEKTAMRPSVVAGATWTAFLTGLVFYTVARYYGWSLGGGEMLAALLGGAVLGIVFEGIARLIRRS